MGSRWSQIATEEQVWEVTDNVQWMGQWFDRDLDPNEVHSKILNICEGRDPEGTADPERAIEPPINRLADIDLNKYLNGPLKQDIAPTEPDIAFDESRPANRNAAHLQFGIESLSLRAWIFPYLISFRDELAKTNWGTGGDYLFLKSLSSFWDKPPAEKHSWYGIAYSACSWVCETVEDANDKVWYYWAFALVKRRKADWSFERSRTLIIFDPQPISCNHSTRPKDLRPLQYQLWKRTRNSGDRARQSRRKVDFYYSQDIRFQGPDMDLTACMHWVDYHASGSRQTIHPEGTEILDNCYHITRC